MFAVNAYIVKELRDRAAVLDIAGRSAMKKDELYATIVERLDTAHSIALEINTDRKTTAPIIPDVIDIETVANYCEADAYLCLSSYHLPSYREVLNSLGWKRAPRKLKKIWRNYGVIAA